MSNARSTGSASAAGHVRVPNAIFDAWVAASSRLSKRENTVLLHVIRQTLGWRRELVRMNGSDVAKLTGMDARDVRRAVTSLLDAGVLVAERRGTRAQRLGVQADVAQWFGGALAGVQTPKLETGEPGANHPGKDTVAEDATGANHPGSGEAAAPQGGANHPGSGEKGGANHPGSEEQPGRNTPEKRGETPPRTELQAAETLDSAPPTDTDRQEVNYTPSVPDGTAPPFALSVPGELPGMPGAVRTPEQALAELPQKPMTAAQIHAAIPEISEQLAGDFLLIRQKKRAPLSPSMLARLLGKGASVGFSPVEVLETCVDRGWQGFEPEWVTPKTGTGALAQRRDLPARTVQNLTAAEQAIAVGGEQEAF